MKGRGRALDLALAAFLGAVLVAAVLVDFGPSANLSFAGRDLGPGCLSKQLIGADCPMCGISHSFVAFADGDIPASFGYHPLGPFMVALFILFICAAIAAARKP